ncbi:hypothetical protein BH10BAC1_BH10BAC1_09900 [soil metagenome]
MNKKWFLIISCFAVLILIVSCKKNPFDYRTKYIGDYDFVNSWTSYNMSATPPTSSGITYSTGKIDYGKDGMVNIIFDNNFPTFVAELKIDRDGNLSFTNGLKAGQCQSRKKMHYSYSGGGLGGGSTSSITGTKK